MGTTLYHEIKLKCRVGSVISIKVNFNIVRDVAKGGAVGVSLSHIKKPLNIVTDFFCRLIFDELFCF